LKNHLLDFSKEKEKEKKRKLKMEGEEEWDGAQRGELDHELDDDEEEEEEEQGNDRYNTEFTSSFKRMTMAATTSSPATTTTASAGAASSTSSTSSTSPFVAAHQILAMPSFIRSRTGALPPLVADDDDDAGDRDGDDVSVSRPLPAPVVQEALQSNINFFGLDQLLQRPATAIRTAAPSTAATSSSSSSSSASGLATATATATTPAAAAQARSDLFVAAFYGNDRDVVALLQAGADPNQTDRHGWTPLALAGTPPSRASAISLAPCACACACACARACACANGDDALTRRGVVVNGDSITRRQEGGVGAAQLEQGQGRVARRSQSTRQRGLHGTPPGRGRAERGHHENADRCRR
jgi:hypothetical protein